MSAIRHTDILKNTNFALPDPPVHTIVISFATCALLLLGLGRNFPESFKVYDIDDENSVLPLQQRAVNTKSQNSARSATRIRTVKDSSPRDSLVLMLLVVLMLTARVELYRRLNRILQCHVNSHEVNHPVGHATSSAH